jgi:predicted transposase/invertase (TIGR01784 family)
MRHKLTSRPIALQEAVFTQLFEQAQIAKLKDVEYRDYEESLKNYRDLKNSLDTAYGEGFHEGIEQVAKTLKENGASVELITISTGLTADQIKKL